MKTLKVLLVACVGMVAVPAMAIPTEVTTAMTDLATDIGTYTGPAVVLAVAVATAIIAVKWTKKFISRAT